VGEAFEEGMALLSLERTGPGFALVHFAFELMENLLDAKIEPLHERALNASERRFLRGFLRGGEKEFCHTGKGGPASVTAPSTAMGSAGWHYFHESFPHRSLDRGTDL
jgi:hypothetical protein